MEGFLPIFFLLVVLKIPVFGALWLIWWASKAVPEPDGAEDTDGGTERRRPEPILPRGPRRGPHGGGARALPPCPPGARTRILSPPAAARLASSRAQRPPAVAPERTRVPR